MSKDNIVHLLKIKLVVYSISHFENATIIFDFWKKDQDKSEWKSSGWAITSPNTGILFISSNKVFSSEAIKILTKKLSRVCLKVSSTPSEITKETK